MLRFGPFEFDTAAHELRRDGVPVPLRARPMAMLRVLLEHAGELVTKDQLLEQAWPGVIVEENNLQVQVSVLRKILGAEAIATVQGRGYRFTLPVSPTAAAAADDGPRHVGDDALIGRDADLALLVDRLRHHRLVTLVGPGGVGKTRLAQAVVATYALSARARWVELAGLTDPALLPACVLAAVAAPPAADPAAAVATLAETLDAADTLLVLDNAEQLLDGVAALVTDLLQRTRRLTILITSQAALGVTREQVVRLDPLAVPAPGTAAEAALAYGAVALFAARAQAVDHRFRLDAGNVDNVLQICRRLDGIPLALELAAGRVRALGVSGLANRLDERFRLLHRGARSAPSRQQTLLAAFDWSFGLLAPREQTTFRRLGVLPPSFSLDTALGALLGPDSAAEWDLVDALSILVERSLVSMDAADPPRYSLLETGHAYALARLKEAGEEEIIDRASRWFEAQGDAAASADSGRAALEHYSHALELAQLLPAGPARDARELELSLKLGPALQATLGPTHPRCEQVYRTSVRLARTATPDARAFKALWGYWQFLTLSGRDREAAPYADEIIALSQRLNDEGLALEALHASMSTRDLLGAADVVVEQARQIIARYDRARHHRLTFEFGGHDPCVCAYGQGSVNLWLSGHPQLALDMVERGLALGDSLTHGYSRAVACYYGAITLWGCGEQARFCELARSLVALSDEFGMAMLLTEGRIFLGRARYEQGEPEGIEEMRTALREIEASGDLGFVFIYMAMLADALIETGGYGEAGRLLARGVRHAGLGQGLFLPEIVRLRGELMQREGRTDAAADDFRHAMELAARQKAVALELRAALSGARAGDARSRERVGELLPRFTGGSTRDLDEAARVLQAAQSR